MLSTKLKIDKKAGTFKLTLPEGCTCVMICTNELLGLVPRELVLANSVSVEYIEHLLSKENVSQVTLIPVDYNQYIHVNKEWKQFK